MCVGVGLKMEWGCKDEREVGHLFTAHNQPQLTNITPTSKQTSACIGGTTPTHPPTHD